jgi:hypothetical protein
MAKLRIETDSASLIDVRLFWDDKIVGGVLMVRLEADTAAHKCSLVISRAWMDKHPEYLKVVDEMTKEGYRVEYA